MKWAFEKLSRSHSFPIDVKKCLAQVACMQGAERTEGPDKNVQQLQTDSISSGLGVSNRKPEMARDLERINTATLFWGL